VNMLAKILEERGNRYGLFLTHSKITQELKTIIEYYLDLKQKNHDPDKKEALDMICHKIGRIVNGDSNYVDSWVDIAGYATLVADRLEGKGEWAVKTQQIKCSNFCIRGGCACLGEAD
ncbi:MAG: hypothetical protein ACRDBG_04210, partial [Waterburya sp.]